MQFDATKLTDAFVKANMLLWDVSSRSGVPLPTVHRIITTGRGREGAVDAVARALGFKRGRKDVLLNGRRTA